MGAAPDDRVALDIEGPVATITNRNPDRHNAFDDAMDQRLFDIFAELKDRPDVRVVIWRGDGPSFGSGRDTTRIGHWPEGFTHQDLVRRGHRGILQVWDIDAPIIAAVKGWTIGVCFERSLLCDIRVAAEDAKFRLPELSHGIIPNSGGAGVLFQAAGHGLVSDMVLTGRVLTADEALRHGVVSRVVPVDRLDHEVREMAERIAGAPKLSVRLARHVIGRLAHPEQTAAMGDEVVHQSFIYRSDDYAEFKAARAEGREPRYRGD